MRLKLIQHDHGSSDWYTIERAEHDGREWIERLEPNMSQFMCSCRLVPDSCIEGSLGEMKKLAECIRRGKGDCGYSAKRCAVRIQKDGVHLWSPRNSSTHGIVSEEDAIDLAQQIEAIS